MESLSRLVLVQTLIVSSTCLSAMTAGRQRTIRQVGASSSRSGTQPGSMTALWLAKYFQQLVWEQRELFAAISTFGASIFRFWDLG